MKMITICTCMDWRVVEGMEHRDLDIIMEALEWYGGGQGGGIAGAGENGCPDD